MYNKIISVLSERYGKTPMEEAFAHDPFQFLTAVMLSARSRDSMTIPTARTLFDLAPAPADILALPTETIEKILHPIGFYRVKTKYLQGMCRILTDTYHGDIPHTFDGLVRLPGVSRKVANVVLGQLFHHDVIAVDIHVHRISNRLGWVVTYKPEATENELMRVLPRTYWQAINGLLVQHGQQICLPIRPHCSVCPISQWCPKIGVK